MMATMAGVAACGCRPWEEARAGDAALAGAPRHTAGGLLGLGVRCARLCGALCGALLRGEHDSLVVERRALQDVGGEHDAQRLRLLHERPRHEDLGDGRARLAITGQHPVQVAGAARTKHEGSELEWVHVWGANGGRTSARTW